MAGYVPASDFLALLRTTPQGVALARAPGLDIVLAALARANMFRLYVGLSPPTTNQATTAWLQPAQPSWTAEGTFWLWNGTAYVTATPALWGKLISPNQDIVFPPTVVFQTRAAAAAATIPPLVVPSILVIRYAAGFEAIPAIYIPGTAGGPGAFQDAGGTWWQLDLTPGIHYASWYGVNGDNGEYSALTQLAVSFAAGARVRLPPGIVGLANPVSYVTTVNRAQALRLEGAGPKLTTIDNRCTGGPSGCIRAQGSPSAFGYNGSIKDINFTSTTGSSVAHVDLYAVYRFTVEDCLFSNNHGNGATITGSLGDADASNIIKFNRCDFTANIGAGLLHNFSAAVVQTTFVRCEDCFFNSNGLTGWYYIGLSGMALNCGFTENGFGGGGNAGLWIANNGGSSAQFTAINCSWENNYADAVRMDALVGGEFINCEIAGSAIPATIGFAVNGSTKVNFIGTRVRFGNSPHVAFNFNASSDCSIANTEFVLYDAAGQTRYVQDGASYGNRFDDSFSAVQEGADNGVMGITVVVGANQNVALPLMGTSYTISGAPAGAFNIGGIKNGFAGRRLFLVNNTGQTMTLNDEDAGSAAVNRIWNGGANLAVPNRKGAWLTYSLQVNRWVLS